MEFLGSTVLWPYIQSVKDMDSISGYIHIIQGYQYVSVHLTITVHTTDDFTMAVTEYIRNVDRAILNTVFENTVQRVNKCLETGGGHFEHHL